MPKRRIVGLAGRVGNTPTLPNNRFDGMVSPQTMLDIVQQARRKAQLEALAKYNAADYEPIIVEQPDVTYVAPIEQPVKRTTAKHTKYIGGQSKFINEIYNSYYNAVRPGAASDADADRQAKFLTQKAALETGYGSSIPNTHNYGGHKTKNGWLSFDSLDDFTRKDVQLLDKKWSNWRNTKTGAEFIDAINTNNGYGMYAPPSENTNYKGRYLGTTKRVNDYINMGRRKLRCGGKTDRPKAFWGALISSVIGAGSSILGAQMQKDAQEEIMEENKRRENEKYYKDMARNMGNLLNSRDAEEAYKNQFRTAYKNGGRKRLRDGAKITDGGPVLNLSTGGLYYAGDKVPYGEYVDLGPTHEERNSSGKTGTGWNINGKKIETENKEVETISPTQMKVYSNNLELPNGMTPAEYVLNGGDENYAFNVQQNMNGDYGIGNKRRLRNGGYLSRPVERIEARKGLRQILKDAYNSVRDSWVGDIWRAANYNVAGNSEGTYVTLPNRKVIYIPGTQGGAPNVLPGRVGGFRPQNIERSVRATRNIANTVRQSVRRATPVNASKAVTRQPKTLNVPKGDVVNSAKKQVKEYNWFIRQPMKQGYQGAVAGRGTMMGNPYDGQLNIGLSVGDKLRSIVNNAPAVPLGVGLGVGVAGGLYNAIDNNDNDNREYVYGQSRGNNASPYSAIQIGLGSPSLSSYNINVPSIDGVAFDSDFNLNDESTTVNTGSQSQPSRGATVNTGRRRLASRGAVPAQTTLTPRTLASPIGPQPYYPDDEIIKEAYKDNELWEGAETSNTQFDIDDDVDTFTPVDDTVKPKFDYSNLAGGIINGVGGLVSGLITNSALDKAYTPKPPVPIMAAKLPTTSLNGEELAEIDRIEDASIKDARENSYSSSGLLSRINRLRSAMNDKRNLSWAERRKNEIQMLTRDALNQEQVGMFNAQRNDAYEQAKAQLDANKSIYKAYNWGNTIDKIVGAYNDYDAQRRQNNADAMTMNWYLSTLPSKDRDWFINQLRGGRNRMIFRT